MSKDNPENVNIPIEAIEFVIEENKCMVNQFSGVSTNDIVIHCHEYLNNLKEHKNE